MRTTVLLLAILLTPVASSAQDETIIVRAAEPVPVSVDAVAEQLRGELPQVPVLVAAGPAPTGTASVTLALSPEGHLLSLYADASGRETARIVTDTHDCAPPSAAPR